MMIVNIFSRENFIFWSADFRVFLVVLLLFAARSSGAGDDALLWRYYGVGLGVSMVMVFVSSENS